MKTITAIIIIVLWSSVGYGEDKIADEIVQSFAWEIQGNIDDAQTAWLKKHRERINTLQQQITDLKAEVEELRKMVEEMKAIDGDSWATWPGEPGSELLYSNP